MVLPVRVGAYVVEGELGAGGMGTVYLARSRGGRPVAVKVARPELAADPHFRARFRAEVDAARKVGGFHTAQVVDADPEAPAPWLATAYVPGPTLSRLLAERGPMGETGLRRLGAALAEALQAVHACGLVHRDLKPGNIIMAEDGPRVLDFGIARALESTRLTSTGAAFGTPGFLAPEQAQGREVGPAADVFALGAVLVTAAGGDPFGDGTSMMLMYRAVHEPADLSALPPALRPVVADCLAKDPGARPSPERILDLLTSPEAGPRRAGPRGEPVPAASRTAVDVPPTVPPPNRALTVTATAATAATAATDGADGAAEPSRRNLRTKILTGSGLALVGIGALTLWLVAYAPFTFPKATYEVVLPEALLDGAYVKDPEGRSLRVPQKSRFGELEGVYLTAEYLLVGAAPGSEVKVEVTAVSGRFKFTGMKRDSLIEASTLTGVMRVLDPARTIRVPGSDVDIRCQSVVSAPNPARTVCGWGDSNTVAVVAFPENPSLDEAASRTHHIRQAIRKPLAPRS
ncbi:serine/threonine-protein kinase [Streptomyces sp. NPDC048606]|uniref:serine/threonine-protein kinase n=1 Tax=Streptomyces sp. NPDC048606 TaxID=3154726 RepID=UPI0034346375